MNAKLALEKIDNIVHSLDEQSLDERLISYSVINTILSHLDVIAEEKSVPNYKEYKHKLLWSCEALCGLDEGNDHSDLNHITWAYSAVQKLESFHCFNVNNVTINL